MNWLAESEVEQIDETSLDILAETSIMHLLCRVPRNGVGLESPTYALMNNGG